MKFGILSFIFLLAACPKKPASPELVKNELESSKIAPISDNSKAENTSKIVESLSARPLREAVYFAASIEREAIKLILKGETSSRNSLFSVLSFILESKAGAKKSTPTGLDCSKFKTEKRSGSWFIYKVCAKNPELAVTVTEIREKYDYNINFDIGAWKSVVGLSVSLTNPNIICKLSLNQEKLSGFSCQHWAMHATQDQSASTIVKLDEFEFNRKAQRQLLVRGGFYRDLVQNKKIDIEVPIDGKIRIIEKEISILDEFSAYTKDGGYQDNGVQSEQKNQEDVKKEKPQEGQNGQEIVKSPEGQGGQEVKSEEQKIQEQENQQDQVPQVIEGTDGGDSQNGGQPPPPETRGRGR